MHHHEPKASSAATQRPVEGRIGGIASDASVATNGSLQNGRSLIHPDHARSVGLEALRQLQGPLASLRVLLEGARGSDDPRPSFSERALEEIERAEQAAHDLIAWTLPRHLQPTATTLGEIVQSLRETLGPADRRRTHFVVESPNASLACDARLLVETIERSLRHAYREVSASPLEIMVHAHASADEATLSFIYTESREASVADSAPSACPSLSEALLRMDVQRAGGRLAAHDAEGHRCFVVTLPRVHAPKTTEGAH